MVVRNVTEGGSSGSEPYFSFSVLTRDFFFVYWETIVDAALWGGEEKRMIHMDLWRREQAYSSELIVVGSPDPIHDWSRSAGYVYCRNDRFSAVVELWGSIWCKGASEHKAKINNLMFIGFLFKYVHLSQCVELDSSNWCLCLKHCVGGHPEEVWVWFH